MPWWFDLTQGSATAMSHISTTETKTKTTTTTHSFIFYNTVDMNNDTFPSIDPSRSIFPPTEPPTLLNAEKTIDNDGGEDYLNDWCYGFFGTDSGKVIVPVIAAISILCCVVIISAITLPLFDKKERKKMSAYNLYLVYLAIPDLMMSIFVFVSPIICHYTQASEIIFDVAFVANELVNLVILYEILTLLIDSKARRRYKPPSRLKASMQALVVYAVSIIWRVSCHFYDEGLSSVKITQYGIVCCALVYLFWVLFRIGYGRLLHYNSDTIGRLKALVLYFTRIICVNMVTTSLYIVALGNTWFWDYFNLWMVIQVWIGFGLSLTKPDVLEYVRCLFACIVRPCSRIWSAFGTNRDSTKPTEMGTSHGNESPRARDPERGDANSHDDRDDEDENNDDTNEVGGTRADPEIGDPSSHDDSDDGDENNDDTNEVGDIGAHIHKENEDGNGGDP